MAVRLGFNAPANYTAVWTVVHANFTMINFIRLNLNDANVLDGAGATIYINLHVDSLSGATIGTTAAVNMPNSFTGPATFSFPTSVTLMPGTTYYFEPVVQPGSGPWNTAGGELNYAGGSAYVNGQPQIGSDLWFREGIIVPEPATTGLLLVGAGMFAYARRRQNGSSRRSMSRATARH